MTGQSPGAEDAGNVESLPKVQRVLHIRPKPVKDKDEYIYYEPQDEVESILRESVKGGNIAYEVRLVGGGSREVSEASTLTLGNE